MAAPAPTSRSGEGGPGRGDRPGPRRGREVSAGQVLCVGLLCFGIWFLLDARQLYSSALSAPLGLRRSVATAILGPVARLGERLSFDRLVDGGNRLLGRAGAPRPPAPSDTRPVRTVRAVRRVARTAPRFYRPGFGEVPGYLERPGPPLVFQPTPAHPLTILEVGDSLGEDLSYGLADLLGTSSLVRLLPAAVGSTGLANVAYYNWPATLARDLARYHPEVVVVLVGGNDVQPFMAGGRPAELGTPFWRAQYGARVATMMREATAAGANVVWVGLPVMASPAFSARMAELNAIFAAQASEHPGVVFVPSWRVLAGPTGHYSEYLPSRSGGLVQVRASDGVHIAPPAGDELLAGRVVAAMERSYGIRL